MLRILDRVFIVTPELTVEPATYYVDTFDAYEVGRRIFLVETENRRLHKVLPEDVFDDLHAATKAAAARSLQAARDARKAFQYARTRYRANINALAEMLVVALYDPKTDPEAVQLGEQPTTAEDPNKTPKYKFQTNPPENLPTDVSDLPF